MSDGGRTSKNVKQKRDMLKNLPIQ